MRRSRWMLLAVPFSVLGGPILAGLFWATSCESDNYRDELPLRGFDAAPHEAGVPADLAAPPADMARPADMATPPDMATAADMTTPADMAVAADMATPADLTAIDM